ncbi:MAG: hypothetical protein GX847_00695 [Clostridiales bacterium]|nr:hypothetical protein [Clostridiales bacterium]
MFFIEFNPMTEPEVNKKVMAKSRADGSQPLAVLAGLSFKACLEGDFAPAQLEYKIHDASRLTVIENGTGYDTLYSAITLDRVVLLTHLIPGTSRGWHLVIDTKTFALTAFETWFGIEVPVGGDLFGMREPNGTRQIPREIQRHYHFGWADLGTNAKPDKLHTTTNRLEGRGLHWQYDNGYELLTFFPSVVCSTLVELSDPRGGITMTNPSDYIRIDDEFYVYSRWEVEFNGKMWIEVLNFFDLKATGVEFGFGEDDELTYSLHTAVLEITGDAAHLEQITSFGDKEPPMAMLKGKGARYAYRPKDIDIPMTKEEAHRHAAEAQSIFETGGPNIMASGNNLPIVDYLAGKKFTVRLDGEKHTAAPWAGTREPVYEYDVVSKDILKWRVPGGTWQEEKYTAFEPAKDLILFSHMLTGDPDFANVTQAVDFSNGLATTVRAQVGSWHSEWEIGAYAKFGVLEYGDIVPPFARRHHFTTDLVGKSYAWAYSDTMSSIHVYSSPESYSWTIFQDNNSGGATWSSPCFFIKLREDAYLFQWVEENCNGSQGLVVFNPYILHDGGFFFGVGHTGLRLNITGAYARSLGSFNIMKYFDKKGNL